MASIVSSFLSFLPFPLSTTERPGSSERNPMDVLAAPGLMTFLDVALFRTVEGQLTATLTTSHALLEAWLDLQRQAVRVLEELVRQDSPGQQQSPVVQMESFARSCFEAACDAIALINTDRLAASANLSDPYDSSSSPSTSAGGSGHHHHRGSILSSSSSTDDLLAALKDAQLDTARRRYPLHQRRRDCWESPRLYCPDHVWADDVWQSCQRLLRQLHKHPFVSELNTRHLSSMEASLSSPSSFRASTSTSRTGSSSFSMTNVDSLVEEQIGLLWLVLKTDLPTRLFQFKAAMEADAVVTKRLYLIKCEYRAPFRAFLEAHTSVQRAPRLELVDEYLQLTGSSTKTSKLDQRRESSQDRLQKLLETPELVEALALEQRCEEYEAGMAQILYPFCELARYLDQKRARLKAVPGVLKEKQVAVLQERLRRLKGLLMHRKAATDSSSGIRPLLLDLQGVPRDEEAIALKLHQTAVKMDTVIDQSAADERLNQLLAELKVLGKLCVSRNAFWVEKKADLDLPASIVRGCTDVDEELFKFRFKDWCAMVVRQDELTQTKDFELLAEKLRRAELQMSLAVASHKSLEVVRQRLEALSTDRSKRFEVLKAMLEEVCLREMNLYASVSDPGRDKILPLPATSALGVFGRALQIAGEPLPIG